jgi:polyhydroxybutyrate depolymerase
MKTLFRALLWLIAGVIALAGVLVGLAGYFLYTPDPDPPLLSGSVATESIVVDGRTRTYKVYRPRGLSRESALLFAMHGSGENSTAMRVETGYAFERLADEQGVTVIYPDGYNGHWNTCEADEEPEQREVDDVHFLTELADRFIMQSGADRQRVFAVGLSEGGYMAIRLALEAPSRFRAVAPVAANLSAPGNFQCKPVASGTSSVMLIHGTRDRLVPYDGAEGGLMFGLFKNSKSRSAEETAEYFAEHAGISGPPSLTPSRSADGFGINTYRWSNGSGSEVELMAIQGAGHVFPQPFYRARRILGASPKDPNAAQLIWAFFSRQRPR